jgi:hypothetical protein
MRPTLYLLIEGPLDSKFFSRSLNSRLRKKYRKILRLLYARESKELIEGFINAGNTNANGEIIFVHDFDNGPCFTQIKTNLTTKYRTLCPDCIIISKKEIESWLLAGVTKNVADELGIGTSNLRTDNIGKIGFNKLKPRNMPLKQFENTLLGCFNVRNAERRNCSFNYFINNFF